MVVVAKLLHEKAAVRDAAKEETGKVVEIDFSWDVIHSL